MLARFSVNSTRRLPALVSLASSRTYSSTKEGSVAQSREFGKREKAQEDEYARRHEAELLKKLKDQIASKKAELAELEKKHSEVEEKTK